MKDGFMVFKNVEKTPGMTWQLKISKVILFSFSGMGALAA
jgi:hypothetical protein